MIGFAAETERVVEQAVAKRLRKNADWIVANDVSGDVFGGDARTLGWMMSASGVGALAGAVYLSTRTSIRGLGIVITLGGVAMGVGLAGCGQSRSLPFALGCLSCLGAGGVLLMASGNTVVQSLVDDDKRGRVMSLFAMAFTGTTPLGNLLIGALAGLVVGRIAFENLNDVKDDVVDEFRDGLSEIVVVVWTVVLGECWASEKLAHDL